MLSPTCGSMILLRVINHGSSVKACEPCQEIEAIVNESLRRPFTSCSYMTVDKGLLCAFAETQQPDSCSFHLSVKEMTMTLDDVSQILHLSILETFITQTYLDRETSVVWLRELFDARA